MTESAGDLPLYKTLEWDYGAVNVTFGILTTVPDGCSYNINSVTMVVRLTPCGSVPSGETYLERSTSPRGETVEIETGAETLKELAEWILALPKEQQNYRVYTTDSEYGPEPWHGVMEMRDEEVTEYDTHRVVHEPRAIVSDSPTQAEYAEFKA